MAILANGKLRPQQLRFIDEYLSDRVPNGKQAAIRAGYSEATAESQASRLLRSVKVQQEIARRRKSQVDRLELKADDVLRELLRIATADITKAFDEHGRLLPLHQIPEDTRRAMSSVETDEFWHWDEESKSKARVGDTRKVKFWDKVRAAELLGKHLKLFTDVVEHQGKLTLEQLVTESQGGEE